MSSFFTLPGANKKRKRPEASDAPKKRIAAPKTSGKGPSRGATTKGSKAVPPSKQKRAERDQSLSESDLDDNASIVSLSEQEEEGSGSEVEGETAAERRLRLAERYLENVREQVDEVGFDAADIDRDLIAERLQEDVAEAKGRLYRQLASEFAYDKAAHCYFKNNAETFTSVAVQPPYAYTTTKDMYVHKWRIQDLPKDQFPPTTTIKKKKNKKPPPPPRRKPTLEQWIRGNINKAKDKNFHRHVDQILCVAASSDGKFLVTGGEDKRIIVYDAGTLKPLRTFTHHRDAVTGLAFRRGTNQLYSCSKDRTVKVWSLDELAYIETLFGHQDVVLDIDALAQERCVSVGARDRTARMWKVVEETQLVFRGGGTTGFDKKNTNPAALAAAGVTDPRSLSHEGSMDRIAMLDDELFVTGSDNGALSLWSVAKKKPLHVLPLAHGLEKPLLPTEASAEAAPDDKVVPPPQPRWITALRTIPYSDLILSGSWDGYIRVWKLSEDKKKIEPLGILCRGNKLGGEGDDGNGDVDMEDQEHEDDFRIRGVVNDIAVFERGERAKDGLCIVVAAGKEHRLGRWQMGKVKGKNGGYVFEVPRRIPLKPEINGHDDAADAEESD
ncbi:ribosomal RNA-processing protein [Sodiomyces alkalinus F11]|uniref:Ribosomal RNA-processing protein n=1 Tax=Sodiomyces alkalinus (strain CBS 110278 / VKM F-3762 / F11) TaxID=1314773 RepID=A0A3N2Q8K9_SODAK|nr:ribosomal RNA-processing protein [Sodiomyces alkalinus F11]ROT43092.1 ribosomal RNA-processing protein [Sodiomyces alkalinus F11]